MITSNSLVLSVEHPKYLHVEVRKDGVYVFFDDKKWGHELRTKQDQDNECFIDSSITIDLSSVFKITTKQG